MKPSRWKIPILFFSLAFNTGVIVLLAIATYAAVLDKSLFEKYSIGLAFGSIFLACCAFIPIIIDKIREQDNFDQHKQFFQIDANTKFEELYHEINCLSIELKYRLTQIEKTEEKIEQNLQNTQLNKATSSQTEKTSISSNVVLKVIGFIILFVTCVICLATLDSWTNTQTQQLNPAFKDAEIVLLAAIFGGLLSHIYSDILQKSTKDVGNHIMNKKNVFAFFILLFFIIGIVLGILLGYSVIIPQKNDMQKIDESYHILYKNFIQNAGKERIDRIVFQTSSLGNDSKRLFKIASIITDDFTDPNWIYQMNDDYFCYYLYWPNHYTYCLIGNNEKLTTLEGQSYEKLTFVSDKKGHIRQGYGTDLSTNPYWVAFQKTGECQELSVLFYAVTKESGFETRIVGADGTHHIWNEVKIDGDWKYFDVQRYGEVKGKGDSSQWFGNRSDYSNNTGFNLEGITMWGVCVHDYQKNIDVEDVTMYYDPNNIYPHGKCKITKDAVNQSANNFSILNASKELYLPALPRQNGSSLMTRMNY